MTWYELIGPYERGVHLMICVDDLCSLTIERSVP